MSLNQELSQLFQAFAAVMEIKGESTFKAIAFSKVGRILKDATFDVRKLWQRHLPPVVRTALHLRVPHRCPDDHRLRDRC